MKKIIILFLFVLLVGILTVPVAFAEEGETGESMQEYFENNWLEKLITGASVFVGVLSALTVGAYKIVKVLGESKDALSSLKSKEVSLEELKQSIEELYSATKEDIEEMKSEEETRSEKYLRQEAMIERASGKIEDIKKMLYLFATNDTVMVKKGYAKEIAEIAGYEEND